MKGLARLVVGLAVVLWTAPCAWAQQQYPVTGMVMGVDPSKKTFTASIQEIPGFMAAMTMPFEVRQPKDLAGLLPGAAVEFTLVVDKKASYAERIKIVRYQSVQADPLAASIFASSISDNRMLSPSRLSTRQLTW